MKRKLAAFIIPYFGKMPDYFELWRRSAERNKEYTFFLLTDLPISVSHDSNVKIIKMSFHEIVATFEAKLGMKIALSAPYKLCDYKPAFGYVFEELIKDFDFWGYCDVDLIFGNINAFINEQLLNNYDKIFQQGHFSLFRNCSKMNELFLARYKGVLDYYYAFRTNYSCHFDENGTVAYAGEYDKDIRVYSEWDFYDVPINEYILKRNDAECCAVWKDGKLTLFSSRGDSEEIMYIHLQKRKMNNWQNVDSNSFAIMRNEFVDLDDVSVKELLSSTIDIKKEDEFYHTLKKRRQNEIIYNIKTGAVKFRINRLLYSWKQR